MRGAALSLAAALALGGCAQPGPLAEVGGARPDLARPPEGVKAADYGARLLRDGEPELALKAFRLSLIEDGSSAVAFAGLGAANRELGRVKQARKILERAVELWPDDPVLRNNLGVALYDLGDYAGARRQFETAFALTSGGVDTIDNNIGITMSSEAKAAADAPEPVRSPFAVVPLGNGQYYLLKQGEASL
jgi:Flp pilus assembly protein TadD